MSRSKLKTYVNPVTEEMNEIFEGTLKEKREDKLKDLIIKAYENIKKSEYPETFEILKAFIDTGMIMRNLDDFAYDLDNADPRKTMNKDVAKIYVEIIEACAKEGDGLALNNLGCFYYNGRFGKKNLKKAINYYEEAAKQGYILAYTNLAYMAYYGEGCDVDYEKAFKYFTIASLYGDDEATYKLGDMYRYGYFVDENPDVAFNLYEKAYNMEKFQPRVWNVDGSKCSRIGDCFYEGIGVEMNHLIALSMYQKAECELYFQIKAGDKHHFDLMKKVTERQAIIREEIRKNLELED